MQFVPHWPVTGLCGLLALLLLPMHAVPASRPRESGPKPTLRIPVEALGYRVPGKLYLLARYTSSSLDFLDPTHLLLTFRKPGLLQREPESIGLDQVVQADVLELPAGRVVAENEWVLRDRGRYVWRLGEGRALLRIGPKLYEAGEDLQLHPIFESPSRLRMVEASPNGQLLLIESDRERHTPEQHRKLVEHAELVGADPPAEDVEIRLARLDEKRLLMSARADEAGDLPVTLNGYLTQQKSAEQRWMVRFHPFDKPQTEASSIVAEVDSTCTPQEKVLNDESVLLLTCPPKHNDRFVEAYTLAGKKLWDGRWQSNFTWPAFRVSANGASVAISWLAINHPVGPDESIDDEAVQTQVLTVLDAHSGALRLGLAVDPIVSAGANFALSADGDRLAVINKGSVEIYDLPKPAASSERNQRAAK